MQFYINVFNTFITIKPGLGPTYKQINISKIRIIKGELCFVWSTRCDFQTFILQFKTLKRLPKSLYIMLKSYYTLVLPFA